jgi:hypothetical protein
MQPSNTITTLVLVWSVAGPRVGDGVFDPSSVPLIGGEGINVDSTSPDYRRHNVALGANKEKNICGCNSRHVVLVRVLRGVLCFF